MEEKKYLNDQLEERIRQLVGEVLDIAPDTLELTNYVYGEDDDGLVESLHWVQANIAIESEFQLKIPSEDMERLVTIGDYVNYIRRRQDGVPPFENISSSARPSPRRTYQKKLTSKPKEQQKQGISYNAWEFHHNHWEHIHNHWEHIEDSLQQADAGNNQEFTQRLQRSGYSPSPILRMGKRGQGMSVEVYAKVHKEEDGDRNYYVHLSIGVEVESIFVSNLPSLLSLLHRLASITAQSQALEGEG